MKIKVPMGTVITGAVTAMILGLSVFLGIKYPPSGEYTPYDYDISYEPEEEKKDETGWDWMRDNEYSKGGAITAIANSKMWSTDKEEAIKYISRMSDKKTPLNVFKSIANISRSNMYSTSKVAAIKDMAKQYANEDD